MKIENHSTILSDPLIISILKVIYALAFPLIILSFFMPYYIIEDKQYWRFQPNTIFPWFYTILTSIVIIADLVMMYRIYNNLHKSLDLVFLVIFNLFFLLERLWQPMINTNIDNIPGIGSGLFLMHGGIFILLSGVLIFTLKQQGVK